MSKTLNNQVAVSILILCHFLILGRIYTRVFHDTSTADNSLHFADHYIVDLAVTHHRDHVAYDVPEIRPELQIKRTGRSD